MPNWYRMRDDKRQETPAIEIPPIEARRWNEQQWGIFWTVNEFKGPRQLANLERINAWAIDMDEGTKDEMRAKLHRSPLIPSLIVETKRGFQAYWRAKDGRAEHWRALVWDRLVPFFGSDKRAKDAARILRAPGYLHWKDPANPFRCEKRWEWNVSYTELEMAERFPAPFAERQGAETHEETKREAPQGAGFWDRVYNLDCEMALERLSGHAAVGGEQFTLRPNASGTKNIFVDGKSTSCWVDKNGRIGSLDGGGPTIAQWLHWYRIPYRDIVELLKQLFPELGA